MTAEKQHPSGTRRAPTLRPNCRRTAPGWHCRLVRNRAPTYGIYDWQRGSRTRLTNGIVASNPVWSPDGQFVVFRSATGTSWVRADGARSPQPLTQGKVLQVPSAFTPDGTHLVYSEASGAAAEIRSVAIESGPAGLRAGKSEL